MALCWRQWQFLWKNSCRLAAGFVHYFNLCILARTVTSLLFSTNISLKLRGNQLPLRPGGKGGLSLVPVTTCSCGTDTGALQAAPRPPLFNPAGTFRPSQPVAGQGSVEGLLHTTCFSGAVGRGGGGMRSELVPRTRARTEEKEEGQEEKRHAARSGALSRKGV